MKILLTGGSGFLGEKLLSRLEGDIRIVARNEGNLIKMKELYPNIEIITGDISDEFIARKALKDIDMVYHLAAFKHVGLAEDQPLQCINSNLIGTLNLLKHFDGHTFLSISTDKAAQVSGVYGASKFLMESVIGEYERLNPHIKYRIVRYGNVLYSTGSVLCKWKDLLTKDKELVVTEPNATRFFWSVDQAIDLIEDCLENATDSKPYCPEMKSIKVSDLLEAMYQKYGRGELKMKVIGLQKGENLHEKVLEDGISSEEAENYTINEIMELI
jgi:UDP-N-acetylglucosamine 4,6-dehydratase/UDP-glucose 4-epimerase